MTVENIFRISFLPKDLVGEPELVAMLQAFYSRSHVAIEDRLATLGDTADKICESLKSWYIGYGHNSIADCGFVPVFFENVSVLFAKAFQDLQLYNGQETSSRYIDFTQQPCVSPIPELSDIQHDLLSFVNKHMPAVEAHIALCNPRGEESEAVYKRTVKARAFDVMRGYIPAGACTNLSGILSLRKWREHLLELRAHPAREVQEIATETLRQLHSRYQNSFKEEDYTAGLLPSDLQDFYPITGRFGMEELVNVDVQTSFDFSASRYTRRRSKGEALPSYFSLPRVQCTFDLDFGSFRDIQRHRNGVCLMPLLTVPRYEVTHRELRSIVEGWYIDSLPKEVAVEAEALLQSVLNRLSVYQHGSASFEQVRVDLQYYLPLCTLVKVFLDYPLSNAIYVSELRTGQTVHHTLRVRIQKMAKELQQEFPEIQMYPDMSPTAWSTRRGTQIIEKKDEQ